MTTLARLVVKLVTDVSEFEAGMKNATKKLDTIGKEISGIGDKLTVGMTLPLVAVGVGIKFLGAAPTAGKKITLALTCVSK